MVSVSPTTPLAFPCWLPPLVFDEHAVRAAASIAPASAMPRNLLVGPTPRPPRRPSVLICLDTFPPVGSPGLATPTLSLSSARALVRVVGQGGAVPHRKLSVHALVKGLL